MVGFVKKGMKRRKVDPKFQPECVEAVLLPASPPVFVLSFRDILDLYPRLETFETFASAYLRLLRLFIRALGDGQDDIAWLNDIQHIAETTDDLQGDLQMIDHHAEVEIDAFLRDREVRGTVQSHHGELFVFVIERLVVER